MYKKLLVIFFGILLLTGSSPAFAQEVLYTEDFEAGVAEGWDLERGWRLEQEEDNFVLNGEGHHWARLQQGQNWTDYTFRSRLKLIKGGIHLNYRVSDEGRYFIGFQEGGLYLNKETSWGEFFELARSGARIDLNSWHDVEIVGQAGHLQVYVDGTLQIDLTDTDPLSQGSIAFETLEGSYAHVDDVETIFEFHGVFPVPVRPDLIIEDMKINPEVPKESEDVAISAVVRNAGRGPAKGIFVLFSTCREVVIGHAAIDYLEAGQTEKVEIQTIARSAGECFIVARVDPENRLKETNEENNEANIFMLVRKMGLKPITIKLLAIADATIVFSSPRTNKGSESMLTVSWNNYKTEEIQRILIRFPTLNLPPDALIEEAWLELVLQEGKGGVATRVSEDWSEEEVTWENQPDYDRPFTSPELGDTARWNVTALVSSWHFGLFPNFGLALLEMAGTPSSGTYTSRESDQPPRLIIIYTVQPPLMEPQLPTGLGPPSFSVDPTLKPFQEAIGPMMVDGEPIRRPLAVLQAEMDSPFTFVADEVLITPVNAEALEAFLKKYGGRMLREPGLPDPPPELADQVRDVEDNPSYLVKINPASTDLNTLHADARELGLAGKMRLSSEDALRLLALVLREQRSGINVSMNPVVQFNQNFPPIQLEEHSVGGGAFEDPINEDWRYPEMNETSVQMTGVNRAWQYMRFATRAPTVWIAIIDGGFALDSNGKPCKDPSGATNIDLPSYQQYDFNDDDYNASGDNTTSCGNTPCPHHGSATTSIATAVQNNRYGIAGVGAPVARPLLFKVDVGLRQCERAIRTAIKWGAKVISMSWHIECGAWCRFFSGFSGYAGFKATMICANSSGVFTVSSAGNNNKNLASEFYVPCVLKWNSLCVGALAHNSRARASYSNWGGASATGTGGVNIWAPGTHVRVGPHRGQASNDHVSGTSLAAPFVAGAAALVWGLNPNLTHKQVRNLILSTRHPPINNEVSPGSINVLRMVLNAGLPLVDYLYNTSIGYYGEVPITNSGFNNLTVQPNETDYFEYTATNYLQSVQFTATYVEALGDLYMSTVDPKLLASHAKTTGNLSSTYSIASKDLCVGDRFLFYVKGANPAVGNAYNLSVQTIPRVSLSKDKNESNDTIKKATVITSPHVTPAELLTVEHPDCRNGLTIHTTNDIDYYTFTIKPQDFTKDITGLFVSINADFTLTCKVSRDGIPLQTLTGNTIRFEEKKANAGKYLVEVSCKTLNAYTILARIYDPRVLAKDLNSWLKHATLMAPPDFDVIFPRPGPLPDPLPDWLQPYPWSETVLFALKANRVTPLCTDFNTPNLSMDNSPYFFTLGTSETGTMNLSLDMIGGHQLGSLEQAEGSDGLYAGLWDAEGNEIWRVEALQKATKIAIDLKPNRTYLLIISGSAETQASLTVDLPTGEQ